MKILNICSILPLEGLKLENDIVLRIQDHLSEKYKYEFFVAKSLPYTPRILGVFNKKWKAYFDYLKRKNTIIQEYKSIIYPWIMLPTSNLYINYLLMPVNFILYFFSSRKALIQEAKKSDIILAQNNIPDAIVAYLLAKNTKTPYVLNIRGVFNPIILRLPFLCKVYENANKIITHSPQNFKKLSSVIPIQLIPHPVDSIFFNDDDVNSEEPIRIISVCRLLKLKNIDSVIIALSKLKKNNKKFIYDIVGEGPELEYLMILVKKLELSENIIFHGYLEHDKVNNFLKKSNIFIMPSYPETLGRSFLEAAAAKCLIIGHEKTGVDGLLQHGESALFVNKETIQPVLNSIFENYSYEFQIKFIDEAKKIIDNLTWLNIGIKYNILFDNVISKEND